MRRKTTSVLRGVMGMHQTTKPYPARFRYAAFALPTAGAGLFFLVWSLVTGERFDVVLGVFGLMLTLLIGGVILFAMYEQGSTVWTLDDDGFSQKSRFLTNRSVPWDDIRAFGFEDTQTALTGFGIPRDVRITACDGRADIVMSADAVGAAHRDCGLIDEFVARIDSSAVDPRMLVLRHFAESVTPLRSWSAGSPLLVKAAEKAAAFNATGTAKALSAALEADDASDDCLLMLADARFLLRQRRAAIRLCDDALTREPEDYWALLCKALALWELRRTDEAGAILGELAERESPYTPIIKGFYEKHWGEARA